MGAANDERLSEIWNQNTSGGTLSKFDYAYDADGNITNWTKQADANAPTGNSFGYDAGNQLISSVIQSTGVGATVLNQYAYAYDLAGNRTAEQIGTGTNGPVAISRGKYNSDNQITNRTAGSGSMLFSGSLSKQGTVTVGGNSTTFNHAATNFTGYATVGLGTNIVPVIAQDYDNNGVTNKYQLFVTNNGLAKTVSYDLNGNETSVVTAVSTNTYQWDAANRLLSIIGPTNQSYFSYDGFGRRVQIIEVTYVTNKFLWDGMQLIEQRDLTGSSVTMRFFGEGEQISGTNYFFTRDHLGSVREVVDESGMTQARYDYDPYGRMTVISGLFNADFGHAGIYYHAASRLNLTLFRAYDSSLGRWLSRDPLAEAAGLNLYSYVANNPLNSIDPLGKNIYTSMISILVTIWNFLHPMDKQLRPPPNLKTEQEKQRDRQKKGKKDNNDDDPDDCDPPQLFVFDGLFADPNKNSNTSPTESPKTADPSVANAPSIPVPSFVYSGSYLPTPTYQPEFNYYTPAYLPGVTESETLTLIGFTIIIGGITFFILVPKV